MNMYFKNVRSDGTTTTLLEKVALDEKGIFVIPNRSMIPYKKKELKNINPYIPEQELANKVLSIGGILGARKFKNARLYIDEGCKPIELLKLIKFCKDMNYEIVDMIIGDYNETLDEIEKKQETNVYTLDGFLKGEFSINCQTEEESNRVLKILHDRGVRWISSGKVNAVETCWDRYKENTIYTIGYNSDGRLTFGHVTHIGWRNLVLFKSVDLLGF